MIHPLSCFFLFAGICTGGPNAALAAEADAAMAKPASSGARYAQLTPGEREDLRGELRRRAQEWATRSSGGARSSVGLRRASTERQVVDPDPGLSEHERLVLREQLRRLHTEPRPAPSNSTLPIPASLKGANAAGNGYSARPPLPAADDKLADSDERSAPAVR